MIRHQIPSENLKVAILGGNSTFTIQNANTEARYTYKVKKYKKLDLWFVYLLTGSDNENDYTFFGTIFDNGDFRHSKKSKISCDVPSIQGFVWVYTKVRMGIELPKHVEIYHEGKCCRCGRTLTVPESILSGFGPECVKKNKKSKKTLGSY